MPLPLPHPSLGRRLCTAILHDPKSTRLASSFSTFLSEKARNLPRSGIRDIMDAAWQLEARLPKGERLIRLEVGQPDFMPPSPIMDATARAATGASDPGLLGYIPNAGLPELRQAVADFHNRIISSGSHGLAFPDTMVIESSNVVVCHGAVGAIATLLQSILMPGDEILLPDPGWVNYEMAARILGGNPILYPLEMERGWKPSPSMVKQLITEKTKALFLCSPSNPTGSVLSQTELEELVDVANEHNLVIVSDEIYGQIYFPHISSELDIHAYDEHYDYASASAPSLFQCQNLSPDRAVVVSGVSKAWAMTGFRVGWLATPNRELADTCAKLLEASISCGVPFSQFGALEAITNPKIPREVHKMVKAYRERRKLVTDILARHDRLDYTPEGAFYILVRISTEDCDSVQLCRDLLEEEHVAVSPGSAFGNVARNCVRVSLASSIDDLEEGTERLCSFLKRRGL